MISCSAVEDMAGGIVCNAHERIVRRIACIVAIGAALGKPVELRALNEIGTANRYCGRAAGDGWPPGIVRPACRSIDLYVGTKVCIHYLASWKHQHIAVVGGVGSSVWSSRNVVKISAIKLEEIGRSVKYTRAGSNKNVSVGEKTGWPIRCIKI